MSMMFLAAMMMAQTSAVVPPVATPAPVAKKQKRAQVCEYVELTGSRSKRRVCRDVNGDLDLGPGIRSVSVGNSKIESQEAPAAKPNGS